MDIELCVNRLKLCDGLDTFRNSFRCPRCQDYTPHVSIKSHEVYRIITSGNFVQDKFDVIESIVLLIPIRAFKCSMCGMTTLHSARKERIC